MNPETNKMILTGLITVSITTSRGLFGREKTTTSNSYEVKLDPIVIRLLPIETRMGFIDVAYLFDIMFYKGTTDIPNLGETITGLLDSYYSDISANRILFPLIHSSNPDVEHSYSKFDPTEQTIVNNLISKIDKNVMLNVSFKLLSLDKEYVNYVR